MQEVAAIAVIGINGIGCAIATLPRRPNTSHDLLSKRNHEVAGCGENSAKNLKKQEISLSEQFAKELVEPFRPDKFHDEYQARVRELIDSKSKGRAAPKPEKGKPLAPVIDLMSALKKSLADKATSKTIKPAKAGSSRKTA